MTDRMTPSDAETHQRQGGLVALTSGHSLDFRSNKRPKCPHCGHDCDIDDNEWWQIYDDNDRHNVECPSCDLPFQIETHAQYTFSTDEQDDAS